MECQLCKKKKLSSEYPSCALSNECNHYHMLVCLRCTVERIDKAQSCPVADCNVSIEPDNCDGYWHCRAKLKQLVFDYAEREADQIANSAEAVSEQLHLHLTTLIGESRSVTLRSAERVEQLRHQVLKLWRGQTSVVLLFAGRELLDGRSLAECGLGDNARVQVLFVLQELTPDLVEIRMSMSWGWPRGRDHNNYLDTACFTFNCEGRLPIFLHSIDFRTQRQGGVHDFGAAVRAVYAGFVQHDGESVKDFQAKTSSSSFTVWPQQLDNLRAPAGKLTDLVQFVANRSASRHRMDLLTVTHMLFVIVTFKDETDISVFQSPQLSVYDKNRSDVPLCNTRLHPRAKGLIVCMLSKLGDNWQVTDVGQPLLDGSVRNQRPVIDECRRILSEQMGQGLQH